MQDGNLCVCCEKELISDGFFSWQFNGQIVNVPESSFPWVLIDVNNNEVALCEECYLRRKYLDLEGVDFWEVDYQFSLEYYQLNRFNEALKAIDSAILKNPCESYFDFRGLVLKKQKEILPVK